MRLANVSRRLHLDGGAAPGPVGFRDDLFDESGLAPFWDTFLVGPATAVVASGVCTITSAGDIWGDVVFDNPGLIFQEVGDIEFDLMFEVVAWPTVNSRQFGIIISATDDFNTTANCWTFGGARYSGANRYFVGDQSGEGAGQFAQLTGGSPQRFFRVRRTWNDPTWDYEYLTSADGVSWTLRHSFSNPGGLLVVGLFCWAYSGAAWGGAFNQIVNYVP